MAGRVVAGLLGLLGLFELFSAENVIARIRYLPAGRVLSSLETGLVARHGVAASAVSFQSVYYKPNYLNCNEYQHHWCFTISVKQKEDTMCLFGCSV